MKNDKMETDPKEEFICECSNLTENFDGICEECKEEEDNLCDFCGVLPKVNNSSYCNLCKHPNLS